MEEPGNSKPDKGRRAQKIKVKGNGFAGLVVLGGAFAIAALIANNKSKRKQNNENQLLPTEPTKKLKSNNEDESVGLRSLLEVESPSIVETHRCCRISLEQGVSKTVSTESQITETRITEERIDVDRKEIANGDQEIVQVVSEVQIDSVSDDIPIAQDGNPPSPSEAVIGHVADVITMEDQCLDVLSKEDGVTAEGDSPKVEPVDDIVVEENQAVQVEIEDYSDGSLSSEEVSVIGKDELCEITSSGIVEENLPEELEIVNDKEDEDDSNCNEDEDYDSDNDGDDEKEGEGSEGTGESSMESNSEAIWPAESLEEESLLLKDMNSQLHSLRQKFNEEGCKVVQKEDKASLVQFASGKESMFKLVQHPRFMLSRAGFITWAILAVGLLLLLLGHQLPMFYQLYNSQMSS